jgi:hypothetical protein
VLSFSGRPHSERQLPNDRLAGSPLLLFAFAPCDAYMTNQEPRQPSTKQNVELYGAAYRLAWEQVPALHRRLRPDIPFRIHSSIRSQVKAGAKDPHRIAFAALTDIHERSDPNSHYP